MKNHIRLSLVLLAALSLALPGFAAPKSPDAKKAATSKKKETTSTATATKPEQKDRISTIAAEVRRSDTTPTASMTKSALVLTIGGDIRERGDGVILFAQRTKSLKDLLDLMRRARDDKGVQAVVIRLAASSYGFAMAQELRLAVEDIRSKGKKTIGVVDDDSQASYLVAAACDEVVMPPSNSLMIYGVKADAYFLRGLLQKVGVTAEIIHIGKYKSYGEMFTEDDFTTPARENMTEIVDDMYAQMVGSIAASRKLSKEDVEAAINRGPATPEEAKAAKLVDRVAYADEVVAELAKSGLAIVAGEDYAKDSRDKPDEVNLFSLIAMMSRQQSGGEKDSKYPLVAVVYAVGPIMPGSSGGFELGSSEEIAADDFIKTLDEIQKDKKVKAVVLRVNSPGGSAFASDLIWRKVVELRKVKPVVASMGDVAASGGYYIAMGASKIIAHEGTLTGSIGVVGGKMNLSGGFDKLGIRKTTISRGDFATLFSETSGFSAVERGLVEKMMHKTYDDFVAKAAEGRGVSREKLKEVAQGRVWSGARAKEAGLVDEIGGMGKAVAEVKALLGMKPDEKVSLLMYPKEVSLFELLQKAMGGNVTAQLGMPALEAAAPAQLRGVLETARAMARLMRREAVLTIMPFVPVIN